jgi:subtilase family serine protease
MRQRRGRSVLASVALVGMGVMSPGAGLATTAARAVSQSVRPLPFAPTHVLGTSLSFPPDTAYCRANIGISCYQPAQLQQAYNLQPLFDKGLTGAGSTIVIVDAFGSPTIAADLQHFDQTFGLPDPPSLHVIEPAGAVPTFPADPFGAADRSGWAGETTLDVEWSHVMAPGANILLVATPQSETEGVQGFPQIVQAENYVINHNLGDVISQSFGATEQTFASPQQILNLRSAFINAAHHNVTVLGSSGDAGATDLLSDTSCCYPFPVNSWPSSDPLVTSVGGTMLDLVGDTGTRAMPDVVWNDGFGAGGGGVSTVFPRPAFQNHVRSVVGPARGTPDVSLSAAVDGGVVFYYSFCDYARNDPSTGTPPLCGPQWHIVGGTSEASPLFAGIVAIADQAAGHRLGDLNPLLYSHTSFPGIVDVTSGNNSFAGVTGFNAAPGYDLASGLGTIDAYKFVTGIAHLTGR